MKKNKLVKMKDYFDQEFNEEQLEKHNEALVQSIFYLMKLNKIPMN